MTIKHKVLKDFQYITDDKKIIILKAKTVIENFTFKGKSESVKIPKEIINNNQDYFSIFDWKEELQSFLRTNKIPQPAVITKKITPFIESLLEDSGTETKEIIVEKEVIKEVIVEKPKIVEKEIFIDKPKIVEKEVIVEKIINDDSQSIELESKLRKVKLKEEQLDQELQSVSKKELELETREKNLKELENSNTTLKSELDQKSKVITEKENELNQRESEITRKEENLGGYLDMGKLGAKIEEYSRAGYGMDIFYKLLSEIK